MQISGYGFDSMGMGQYYDGLKNQEAFDMEKNSRGMGSDMIERKATIAKTDNRVTLTPEELSQITGLGSVINLLI